VSGNECTRCNAECPEGVGLTIYQRLDPKGKWDRWRYCKRCAVEIGELGDERGRAADELAERSGV
jgi:Pyruvate/2-oxoacid:ferredoxin oxidoreductase delta subunit